MRIPLQRYLLGRIVDGQRFAPFCLLVALGNVEQKPFGL
jgi:hypothetical protein